MTREEFSILVKSMKAVYADPKFIADQDAFNVWYAMLKHIDYKPAAAAVQEHMMSSQFPPTPADINLAVAKPMMDVQEELSDAEAWDMVWKAICDSTYHSRERFEEFPEAVKKAVGSPDNLRMIAMQEGANPGVEKSHFLNSYHIVCKRIKEERREQALFPASVREALAAKPTAQIEVKDDGKQDESGRGSAPAEQ